MTFKKREDTGNIKRKHYIALCGELAFEDAMHISQYRLKNERVKKGDYEDVN